MTSRERILAAMRLETPDRVPVTPFGMGKLDMEASFTWEFIRRTDPILTTGGGGDAFLGRGAEVASVQDGDVTVTTIHTPKGDLTRKVRRTAITSATVKFPFETLDDVERFLSIPYAPPAADASAFHALKARAGEEALVMVGVADAVCLPASWFSPEGFCLAWADAPDLVVRLTAVAADRANAHVEALCGAGVDAFRVIGGEYASVQLGPKGFDALVTPFDTELVAVMHRHDALAYYHNHGPVTQFLGRFAGLGIDALDPLEAPPWGDCDLAEAKRQIGDRVCLVGNLDDMEVVEKRTTEEVRQMARECLEKAGPGGFLLGGTASGTYTEAGARNFAALVEVAEEYGRKTRVSPPSSPIAEAKLSTPSLPPRVGEGGGYSLASGDGGEWGAVSPPDWACRPFVSDEVWERVTRSMAFEEGDRVPIWDYIDNRGIVGHFAQPGDDYDRSIVRVYHGLGIDLCRGYGRSFGEEDEGETAEGEEADRKVSGLTSWVTRYPIRGLDGLRAYQPTAVDEEWVRTAWVAEIRRRQALFAPHTMYVPGHGCGFHAAYGLMGQTLFSYAIYDARSDVDRIVEALNQNAVCHARAAAQARLCPLFFIGDDIAYKGRLMFSPKFLRETFLPCLKRMMRPLKEAGIRVIYHSDGDLMEILDDLVEAGIDGLNPIEPAAGMDIGQLKRRYGRRLILVGNVDCSQVLPLGSVEDVRRAVRACVRAASPGGGHFIGSSSEVTPSTPVENVLAFYEACREYGRYPIRV
ncbi:MAG: hypothetical protein A3F84_18820 [Candidatus Handelsmanbacteria bacterium RIFCSPLOWO2_12_FULL_64_10]|uniref:Uroporphyrinogen decarboxylase (URO-D) domain-containing protein n=1 Tax=Handelsmanbacteria sp. (strain RIFCSPLOWO2_12_FULL_64_10) TaxID=1817868 RepID=A0A1F6D2G3_HANXR|nr:MAG: hypothetical protein A3F84_18820 [Candidatus Handelsmanbacteria bacterium RIFCSPLOWO2_12_FULL_64_10]